MMLKVNYLGIFQVEKFKHVNKSELLLSAYPYRIHQNVLNELVANAVFGDGIPYTCRDIEAVLKQVVNELPENYNSFTEKDSRVCVKLSW